MPSARPRPRSPPSPRRSGTRTCTRAARRRSSTPPAGRMAPWARCIPRSRRAGTWPAARSIASLSLDYLLALIPETTRVTPVPNAQPIDRDLAVVLEQTVPVGELMRIARMSAGPTLADLRLFDAYRGPQAGEGRVSYALALRFQPARRPMKRRSRRR